MRARTLALALLLPLLAACASGGDTADPAPVVTRTVVTTTTPLPLPTIVGDEVEFRTADGKVGCDLSPAYVLCNVLSAGYTPPKKPGDCKYTWGKAVELSLGSKGSFFCGHGEDYTRSKRVLRPDQALKSGLVTCRSVTGGVECTAEGHGFQFGPKSYRLF